MWEGLTINGCALILEANIRFRIDGVLCRDRWWIFVSGTNKSTTSWNYEHNSVKYKTKYTSKNSLEPVLQLLNRYILQIAYSYNSYKFYSSGVITRRKKIYNSGVIAKRTFKNYGLVHKIMENKKKRQENNFQSVHKKNKGYWPTGIVRTRLDEAEH